MIIVFFLLLLCFSIVVTWMEFFAVPGGYNDEVLREMNVESGKISQIVDYFGDECGYDCDCEIIFNDVTDF